ncbi:MAG: alpha/beta fold hydrolase [Gammaproteobacteria bacterium]|nr:alpha/beta fold hydrolase [Gammaproteobacteria bacterium]
MPASPKDFEPLDFIALGEGPGIVMIHGTGADAEYNWRHFLKSLTHGFRIVAPNLPGSGKSRPQTNPLEVPTLAAQVVAAADAAGVDGAFDVVGHSLGAIVAVGVAAAAPDRVRSLALHGGFVTAGPRERLMFQMWERLLTLDKSLLARIMILNVMSPALLAGASQKEMDALVGMVASDLHAGMAGQINLDGRVDIADLLAAIHVPTLVLASADDQIMPTYHQRALAGGITGSIYKELPGGHGVPFENSQPFLSEIENWISAQHKQPNTTT